MILRQPLTKSWWAAISAVYAGEDKMRTADRRLPTVSARWGIAVAVLWAAFVLFEVVGRGLVEQPLPTILLGVIGAVLLGFVVSEWMVRIGSYLRRPPHRPDRCG